MIIPNTAKGFKLFFLEGQSNDFLRYGSKIKIFVTKASVFFFRFHSAKEF